MTLPHLKKQLVLKKNEDRRILGGHPWAFSNEVREIKGAPEIGDLVELQAASGLTLGIGLYNPHSLICFRLLSTTVEPVDDAFFRLRIERALRLRRALYPGSETFRLVHGEGDFLPGLVIDKYNDFLAVQTLSFGMDARLPMICDILEDLLHPGGIVERNESPLRLLEQLPQEKGILRGSVSPVDIVEHRLTYQVNVLEGQKTGFFLDQRENRAIASAYSNGANVLDCFCNEGGFALNAVRGGALSVTGIDVSAEAVATATANAHRNGIQAAQFEQGDVFDKLAALASAGKKFDMIILDPPSFTKSRKNVQAARRGYRELHTVGLRLLTDGGFLLTASCSHHIEPEVFLDTIDEAARRTNRRIQLLDWRGASADHPTLPAVPETRYLKFGVFNVLD